MLKVCRPPGALKVPMSRRVGRVRSIWFLGSLGIVSLVSGVSISAHGADISVTVDTASGQHPISPYVYGVNAGSQAVIADLNTPINRHGGDATSMYNWQLNAQNCGQDWFYESLGSDDSSAPGELGDSFIAATAAGGGQSMLTIPTIGWVPKLGAGRAKLSSFSVAKYGQQQYMDADAGNGTLTNGTLITNNDPNDANIVDSPALEKPWIQHLVSTWGTAAAGGLKYYILDNEPGLWYQEHRDVHPVGPTGQEVATKTIQTAAMIKSVDPSAQVVAPEEWGWNGYFYSGYDTQSMSANGINSTPDKTNNMGGMDYIPWLLTQWKAAGHPVDVFSLHYYPQGGEYSDDDTTATQLLRNRSTRSLWDPNYVDTSWINSTVELIPRMKAWVSNYYYANTPLALTEYSWGDDANINGATAEADLLGIFGREGLTIANRWVAPDPSTPTYLAMKMYRNYDGAKSTFGDTSVSTTTANPDVLSAFGATRSADGALTVMVINKSLTDSTSLTVMLSNFAGNGTMDTYQLTSSNVINHVGSVGYSGSAIWAGLPPQSITLLVFKGTPGAATMQW